MTKSAIKSILSLMGYTVRKNAIGDNDIRELQLLLTNVGKPVIMDVGAHYGETARAYAKAFPSAAIYSFEPFPKSFGALKSNSADYPNAILLNKGLSDVAGKLRFNANVGDPTNSLLELDGRASQTWNNSGLRESGSLECDFTTIDQFLTEYQLDRIHLLKIDVQGAEYRVLQGAREAIDRGLISNVFFELIVGPTYVGQWSPGQYFSFLENCGFRLHGLYNFAFGQDRNIIQLDALFTRP